MPQRRRKWELVVAAAFVVVHLTSPLWVGELYPFTISPMFCDSPRECCQYEVFAGGDREVDLKLLNLHMVYDGNPPGLGMGIAPTATLHEFGEVPSRQQVVGHVKKVMEQSRTLDSIDTRRLTVVQHHFFPENYRIGHRENRWVVDLDSSDGRGADDGEIADPEAGQ
jgi:hypothetical protein